ncbi:MAG: VOC family protein [Bauldia sp.]|nr:VOC family protein [Bauldia sp.]
MKITLTTIYVDDLEKALRFYTDVFGFAKKADFSNGGYRWLTVGPADDPNGVQLHLELAADPDAKAFQKAQFAKGQPALLVNSSDIRGDAARITGAGGKFRMEPTDVTGSTIAQIEDGVGNLVQLVQLSW